MNICLLGNNGTVNVPLKYHMAVHWETVSVWKYVLRGSPKAN